MFFQLLLLHPTGVGCHGIVPPGPKGTQGRGKDIGKDRLNLSADTFDITGLYLC